MIWLIHYLNVLLRLIISCVKGNFDCSLKTKSALKASINMMTTLSNFGGKGCPVPSLGGSGGKFSLVALPWIAFFSGKKPLKNSIKPTIWQNKRRSIRAPWPQDILILFLVVEWMSENVFHLKVINRAVYKKHAYFLIRKSTILQDCWQRFRNTKLNKNFKTRLPFWKMYVTAI